MYDGKYAQKLKRPVKTGLLLCIKIHNSGKTVSRVLSFKAIIYLRHLLPNGSSHPSGLRIKFAARRTPVGVASGRVYMAAMSPLPR